jgi:hypothetical protein
MRRGTSSFALNNRAPVLASVAEDNTTFMIEQGMWMAPFIEWGWSQVWMWWGFGWFVAEVEDATGMRVSFGFRQI